MINDQEILNASILIVDDQESNIQLLAEILRDIGYTKIATTNDPYKVSTLHEKDNFDLILLDLLMPGMDGFQVIEKIKQQEDGNYTPILVITAQPIYKIRALASGARDFISKPFDIVEVGARIHNMLEVRLLYKKLEQINKDLEQTIRERTAELIASEERFRRLTELSSDWYWEQDENGVFTKIFGPALEMIGIRVDDKQGNVRDDYKASWDKTEKSLLENYLTTKSPFLDFVYTRTPQDSPTQYLMVSGEPLFDTSGRLTGYRGVGKEVTNSIYSKRKLTVTE